MAVTVHQPTDLLLLSIETRVSMVDEEKFPYEELEGLECSLSTRRSTKGYSRLLVHTARGFRRGKPCMRQFESLCSLAPSFWTFE